MHAEKALERILERAETLETLILTQKCHITEEASNKCDVLCPPPHPKGCDIWSRGEGIPSFVLEGQCTAARGGDHFFHKFAG